MTSRSAVAKKKPVTHVTLGQDEEGRREEADLERELVEGHSASPLCIYCDIQGAKWLKNPIEHPWRKKTD